MDEQFNTERRELRIMPPDIIVKAVVAALGMLALFLLVSTFKTFREYRYVGSGIQAGNTITVSGEGEVFAVPDIATFSVTVQEEASEVQAAQETATRQANDIIAYLRQQGIEERDIRTTDYSVYPQYDWVQAAASGGIQPPGRQVLRGYQVSQTISVKVRDTEKAGELLAGVGSRGASRVSGLSFTIDDEDVLQAQARGMAIGDAQEKAEALARQLGVRVVRIVGFNEGYGAAPYPAFARSEMAVAQGMAMDMAAAPSLPVGENKITSNVNITYEIR